METIEILDDGIIKITIGDTFGYVSSYHLVEPKRRQMMNLHNAQATVQIML